VSVVGSAGTALGVPSRRRRLNRKELADVRRAVMHRLRSRGYCLADIAGVLGCSVQNVHQGFARPAESELRALEGIDL